MVFQNADKVLNTDEMDRFNLLSIKNQFLVLLSVLGFEDEVQDVQTKINREAKALVTSVSDRIAALSDAEKPAVDQLFPPTKVTINSKECNSIGIVLVIDHNGTRDYNRYTFYEADDAWRLYQIEQGKLK